MVQRQFSASAIVPVLVLATTTLSGEAGEPAPIRVLVQVPSRTYYVGQAIELRVGAEAEGERPEVSQPEIPNTEVALIDTSLSPIAATGIGALTTEQNLFVTRFRLIPHRAGTMRVPPIRVHLGARSGVSQPLPIEVKSLPVIGRPAEFLGGVGGFAVEAEARPTTLRAGQDLSYTIRVTGPAARSMSGAPDLVRFPHVPLGLQVESLPDVVVNSPPSREFRYRIRPIRAGTASLPPVSIAAFDPQTARYVTKVTSSIPIRVVDVPKFDAATLDYQPPPAPSRFVATGAAGVAVLSLGLVAILVWALVAWTRSACSRFNPRRLLLRRVRALDPRQGGERTARLITDTLAEYLEGTIGRPRGVITPDEARTAIAEATSDDDLGDRSACLVADCDRACYSDREPSTSDLVAGARSLFRKAIRRKKTRP